MYIFKLEQLYSGPIQLRTSIEYERDNRSFKHVHLKVNIQHGVLGWCIKRAQIEWAEQKSVSLMTYQLPDIYQPNKIILQSGMGTGPTAKSCQLVTARLKFFGCKAHDSHLPKVF